MVMVVNGMRPSLVAWASVEKHTLASGSPKNGCIVFVPSGRSSRSSSSATSKVRWPSQLIVRFVKSAG